ncbi:hypothetical protein BDY19DRAFT_942981 [Irpex rosettiformis]|uniref:Uncharacterized protein n=1 Tax=Irpex rosettiformis TaxID=378272 RepID=A0ACB8U5C9_9APHY|nr:hypothetical protein BDY19DRAFT_942981 [Irpex rosettiformis]
MISLSTSYHTSAQSSLYKRPTFQPPNTHPYHPQRSGQHQLCVYHPTISYFPSSLLSIYTKLELETSRAVYTNAIIASQVRLRRSDSANSIYVGPLMRILIHIVPLQRACISCSLLVGSLYDVLSRVERAVKHLQRLAKSLRVSPWSLAAYHGR